MVAGGICVLTWTILCWLLLCFQVLGNSTPKNAMITYRKDKIFNTLLKHIGNVSFEGVRQLKNWLSLKNKMRLYSHDIDLEALLFLFVSKIPLIAAPVLKHWRKLTALQKWQSSYHNYSLFINPKKENTWNNQKKNTYFPDHPTCQLFLFCWVSNIL